MHQRDNDEVDTNNLLTFNRKLCHLSGIRVIPGLCWNILLRSESWWRNLSDNIQLHWNLQTYNFIFNVKSYLTEDDPDFHGTIEDNIWDTNIVVTKKYNFAEKKTCLDFISFVKVSIPFHSSLWWLWRLRGRNVMLLVWDSTVDKFTKINTSCETL